MSREKKELKVYGITGEYEGIFCGADTKNLDFIMEWMEKWLMRGECPANIKTQIMISMEELFVNVCHYAYKKEKVNCDMPVSSLEEIDRQVSQGMFLLACCNVKEERYFLIKAVDAGTPYNPLEKEDPDVNAPAEDREIGGLGIYLTKVMMDSIEYLYADHCNVVTLKKYY